MFCFHDRLRTITLSSGVEIKMCPDCTTFDNKRKANLHTETPLSLSDGGTHDSLSLLKTVVRPLDGVYDHDWATRQKAFPHSQDMPRLKKNFCPQCLEYVNQDHEH